MIVEVIFLHTVNRISVTFVNKDGSEKTICVPVGMSMLEAAHENDIELEGTDIKEMCTSLPLWFLPLWFYSQFMLGDKNICTFFVNKNKLVLFIYLVPWFYHFSSVH
jgi:hypothetical protein